MRYKILLIDDDRTLLRFLSEYLQNEFEVIIASNGAEGLRLGVEATPAVFVNGRRLEDSVDTLGEWIEEE